MKSEFLISIISILISLYVIVLSIIGTSRTPVSEEVLRKRLDKKILRAIAISTFTAILSIVLSAFLPGNRTGELVNSIALAINLCFFVYMFIVLLFLCQKNMNAMANEIDEEKKKNTKNENLLKEIKNLLLQLVKKNSL